MTEVPEGEEVAREAAAPARSNRAALVVTATVAEAAGFALVTELLLTGRLIEGLLLLQFTVCVGMLIAVLWVGARRRREWSQPLSELQQLMERVRRGDEPIESLSRVGGKLGNIALACQGLLRDLRQQRAINAQFQDEMRQRVASKTEALERTIGALRHQAARDPLTGLFNRRTLDDYLPEAIERCQSTGAPLCLLMIDLDYFKPLNDTLGHAAGDHMLRTVAQLIRSTIRERDVAFRYGGDEFVILLDGDESAGRAVAERLASLADATGRGYRVARPPTLSIGISTLARLQDPTPQSLLHHADEELYRVKSRHHAEAITAAAMRPHVARAG
jgi:diguanylate cyclase (GGDEF)-like protein